jgi:peptide/nickel transport system permease protein
MNQYLRYVGKRLLQAIPLLLAVTVVVFVIVHALPGDPAVTYAGVLATEDQLERIRERMGWDRPLPVQYVIYMRNLLQGDLGISLFSSNPVLEDIKSRFPATLELILYSITVALTLGVPLGMLTAAKGEGVLDWLADKLTFVYSLLAGALPDFWWALMLVYVLFYRLRAAPAPMGRIAILVEPPTTITGMYVIDSLLTLNWAALKSSLSQLALPVGTLSFFVLGPVIKITRESCNEALNSNYVRFARQCGLSGWRVAMYALRNALTTVITVTGIFLAYLIGAAVLIENVFAWGGLGQYAVSSVINSDYFAIQGVILVMAAYSLVVYLLVDLLYAAVDPRVRLG